MASVSKFERRLKRSHKSRTAPVKDGYSIFLIQQIIIKKAQKIQKENENATNKGSGKGKRKGKKGRSKSA